MTYEEWRAEVLRLLKPPKEFDAFEEEVTVPSCWKDRDDPAAAVVHIQILRDGGDPYDTGEHE